MELTSASAEQLQQWESELTKQYDLVLAKKCNLDLTRGKPSTEQVSLADALDSILEGNYISDEGVDTRNYGGLEGLLGARKLGSLILGLPVENVLAQGNSSLTLMHQTVSAAYLFGLNGSQSAWKHEKNIKFLCPVPGYDRHFSICEQLGIEMINVAMTATGPDMDEVERLVSQDSAIKGMWCVPKYSNPTGVIYSKQTVSRIAKLGKIAGDNFRVFWDNAYAIHDLSDTPTQLANIYDACVKEGTQDSVIQFASTSKVTHAGAGISFIAASSNNINGFKKALSFTSIGPDKVNQLRHIKFFSEDGSLQRHMKKHAAIIKPKFDCVLEHLETAFANNNLGQWEYADGGYFISFDTQEGLAKDVVKMAGEAGVKLTPAGATFPYGADPKNANIRIAPTVPNIEQVNEAMETFVLCVKLASVRKAINR